MKNLLCAILLFLGCLSYSAEIIGKVVGVTDGDTITVLDDMDKGRFRIRLDKIDAPEKKQTFGAKAKQYLSTLIYGKKVKIRFKKIDNYGRILGIVYLDGKEINLQMVQDGLAWHYRHYDNTESYITAEQIARANKKGLWIEKDPINPYIFRKNQKKNRKQT